MKKSLDCVWMAGTVASQQRQLPSSEEVDNHFHPPLTRFNSELPFE